MPQSAHETNCSSDELLLDGNVEDYEYLNKSRREVDGVDDREEWGGLKVSPARRLFHIGVQPCPRQRLTQWDLRQQNNSTCSESLQLSFTLEISSSIHPEAMTL